MKPDLYTKTVLTIIAGCLVMLVLKNSSLVPEALAAAPATNRAYGLVPVNADGSVTVRLQTAEAMPVNIVGVHRPFSSGEVARYSWDVLKTAEVK